MSALGNCSVEGSSPVLFMQLFKAFNVLHAHCSQANAFQLYGDGEPALLLSWISPQCTAAERGCTVNTERHSAAQKTYVSFRSWPRLHICGVKKKENPSPWQVLLEGLLYYPHSLIHKDSPCSTYRKNKKLYLFSVGCRQPKIKFSFFLISPPSLHLSVCCGSSCCKLSQPARFKKQDNFPLTLNCHLNPASLRRHVLCLQARFVSLFFSSLSFPKFPSCYLLAFCHFFQHVLAQINTITHWLWWRETPERSPPAVPVAGWKSLRGRRWSWKEGEREKIERDRHV